MLPLPPERKTVWSGRPVTSTGYREAEKNALSIAQQRLKNFRLQYEIQYDDLKAEAAHKGTVGGGHGMSRHAFTPIITGIPKEKAIETMESTAVSRLDAERATISSGLGPV